MPAKTNKVKKAEKREADKAKGFKSMTFLAGATTVTNLGVLMDRYHFEDWRELVTRLIDATAEGQLADVIPVPRHKYEPSPKVLRSLERRGILQAQQMDKDDE